MTSTEQQPQESEQSSESQPAVDAELVRQLAQRAAVEGVELAGPGGLLQQLTKQVLETGLEVEMSEHLGYDKHEATGRDGESSRNGTRVKTVTTEVGPVEFEVPRDREGSFEPKIVRKRQRRLHGVDEMVLSLAAKGLTTGEISAHLAEVYGTEVSKDTISTITDTVIEEMTAWQDRPLERVYPVIFIDALVVKVRVGQVTNRPVYTAVGVTVDGERDILGLWIGAGGEGAKSWLQVLTEIKNGCGAVPVYPVGPAASRLGRVGPRPPRRPVRACADAGAERDPMWMHLGDDASGRPLEVGGFYSGDEVSWRT